MNVQESVESLRSHHQRCWGAILTDAADPRHYDLVVDASRFGIDAAAGRVFVALELNGLMASAPQLEMICGRLLIRCEGHEQLARIQFTANGCESVKRPILAQNRSPSSVTIS